LLMTTREKEVLPELIELIPQVGRGRIWQLEDLLLQLAGSYPKEGRFLKSPESLTRSRDAWLGWWKEKGDKVDFVKFEFKPRLLGITDMVEMDTRYFTQGRIVSLGPDLKEKWRITSVNFNPTDVLVVSNDLIFVVEMNSSRITERTSTGTLVNSHLFQQPLNIQRTPEGGMLVVCRHQIVEVDKDWNKVRDYPRQAYDLMSAFRLPKGDILFITNAIQGPNCIRLDNKLKETGKTYTFGRIQNTQSMDAIDDDTILVCESDRVAEYDLKTGKQTWKHECNSPTSCQRLMNGNTLISLPNTIQVIEVDPSGEVVWDYQAKDMLKVGRARRR
jgi:outer membrane protein assembly factor BamB